jgi:hypothetical protein
MGRDAAGRDRCHCRSAQIHAWCMAVRDATSCARHGENTVGAMRLVHGDGKPRHHGRLQPRTARADVGDAGAAETAQPMSIIPDARAGGMAEQPAALHYCFPDLVPELADRLDLASPCITVERRSQWFANLLRTAVLSINSSDKCHMRIECVQCVCGRFICRNRITL